MTVPPGRPTSSIPFAQIFGAASNQGKISTDTMANYYGALKLDGPSHDSHSNDAMDGLNTRFKSFTIEQMSSWATTRSPSPSPSHPPPLFSSSAPSSPSLEPPPWIDRYRTRRYRQKRSDSAPPLPGPQSPKHCVDRIFDTDGTSIGEIVNRDTDSARSFALDLCFPKSQSRGEDIVFWTDASYGSITESKSGAHGQVKQWDQMKQNPEKWRAGVAIAWDVAHSSGLRRRQHRVNTGAWRDEYYTLLSPPRAPNNHHHSSWHANHEAAWQVTGLQHYNQAELLGVTLALQRAVDILRHAPPSRSSQSPPPTHGPKRNDPNRLQAGHVGSDRRQLAR